MKKSSESIINVVIGTAGHIDHGKSTLVEKLTGIHPDRLPEEKERGLTIDLGFSRLTLRNGKRVGIIDVPGHERLIKNMVAGATGIDIVLLAVAADDGVMPQTREHLAIMELLGLAHGIVALTKADLVDEDMLQLARDDVALTLRGTFLEDAPLIPVSSVTGLGIPELLEEIHRAVEAVRPRDSAGVFRMPIQRVFSAKGFGTVVTGIPLGGSTRTGDLLEIVPLGARGRVRGLHAYGEPVDQARAGHSSAVNLTDVDYRLVHRGMVLTEPGYFRGSTLIEARLRCLPTNPRPLETQSSIRLHVGTAEALGKVHLLDAKSLGPGEEGFVQFRLEEPAVAAPGDRFVLRLHSPLETVGGGEVLGASRWRLKAGKPHVREMLERKEAALAEPRLRVLAEIDSAPLVVPEKDVAVRVGLSGEEARDLVARLMESGDAIAGSRPGTIVSRRRLEDARRRILEDAESWFRENPRSFFIDKLKLRQSLGLDEAFFQETLRSLESEEVLREEPGNKLRFRDHGRELSAEDEGLRDDVVKALQETPFATPTPAEIAARLGRPARPVEEILAFLSDRGEAVRLAEDVFLHRSAIEEARRLLREHLEARGTMTAADARNVLGSTRRYVIPLLEHLDREGFTVRRGDLRELRREAR